MTKIALCIPYYRWISFKTHSCLWATARRYKGVIDELSEGSCYTHWNRERLVERALQRDYSHVWFVDTDMIFAPDTLDRLLAHDVDVVGAYYAVRGGVDGFYSGDSTLKIDKDGALTNLCPPLPSRAFCRANGYPLCGIPTGMMLIRRNAFEKMAPPYFKCERPVGEDVYFCGNLYLAGVQIWCDPTINVGHIGETVYE